MDTPDVYTTGQLGPHDHIVCGARSRQRVHEGASCGCGAGVAIEVGEPCRCRNRPAKGRARCRFHGGATPRGWDSPHWKHGRHSKDIANVRAKLQAREDELRRLISEDRMYLTLAIVEGIDARLAQLEAAVLGEPVGAFQLTEHPDEGVLRAPYVNQWLEWMEDGDDGAA